MVETLCVVGCIAVGLAVMGGSTWHVQSSMELRNTTSEFLQTVKTARQFAVSQRCRTRVVFRSGLHTQDEAIPASEESRSYRIHAFVIPSTAPGDAGRWVPVSGKEGNSTAATSAEWARIELSPRSESMVGRWVTCSIDPSIRKVPETVKITSKLFERFKADDREVFFSENFYTPETTWTRDVVDPHSPENCFSVFPFDYRSSPIDLGPVVLTGELPDNEECLDPVTNEIVKASTFWPGHARYIRGMDPEKMEELPAVEFQPDGSLACVWTRELEFSFAYEKRPQGNFVVLINAATGLARMEQAQVK